MDSSEITAKMTSATELLEGVFVVGYGRDVRVFFALIGSELAELGLALTEMSKEAFGYSVTSLAVNGLALCPI
jgi:hypothetical protein